MAGSTDETNTNKDGADKKKPPKDAAGDSIQTSKVAQESGNKDFDESMREEREKTEAAIRAGVATTAIEFNQIGFEARPRPTETLQSRENIEADLNPLSP